MPLKHWPSAQHLNTYMPGTSELVQRVAPKRPNPVFRRMRTIGHVDCVQETIATPEASTKARQEATL